MSVFESTSIDKNFDYIIEDLNKMKEITLSKFNKLEESTGLSKIQHLKPLKIDSFSARLTEKKDFWDYKPVLRVEWKGYDTDKYIKEHGISKGIRFEENYHYVYIYFDESNNESLDNMFEFINKIADSDKNTHEENIEKVNTNRATEKKVFDILEQIGINNTYYGYKTSRSRDTSKMYYNFPSEIKKQIPTIYSESKLDDFAKEYASSLFESTDHITMVTDRDTVITVAGGSRREYLDKNIGIDVIRCMESRRIKQDNGRLNINFIEGAEEVCGSYVIAPIILQGEPIGSIILLNKDENKRMGQMELKMAETAASFLAKRMDN